MELLPEREVTLRLGVFAAVLVALWAAETWAPRRATGAVHQPGRRLANLSLAALNAVLLRAALPAGAVGVAAFVEMREIGLLHRATLPTGLALALGVVALDLVIYFQHRAMHAVPWLWRVHRIHHADRVFDVTTGFRFHPVEIAVSFGIKAAAIAALGVSPLAVLLFEVLLSSTSLFNHANLALPPALDRVLRLGVVTPDMHRVHHSVIAAETNSNFGFNLPWWDRVLGTYRAEPAEGHTGMTIGLPGLQRERRGELRWALAAPFRSQA